MYYVGCFYSDGSEVLGTGDGQGFYEYKRLSTVVKKLRDNQGGYIFAGNNNLKINQNKT